MTERFAAILAILSLIRAAGRVDVRTLPQNKAQAALQSLLQVMV